MNNMREEAGATARGAAGCYIFVDARRGVTYCFCRYSCTTHFELSFFLFIYFLFIYLGGTRIRLLCDCVMNTAFCSCCAWRTPFYTVSADDAGALAKDAALGALPVAGSCRKRPRMEMRISDYWRRKIRHAVESLVSKEGGDEEFSWKRVVLETCRVLRGCWLFHGRPQDTFEPAHSLGQVAQHLLIAYGGYGLTDDRQFIFLQGEQQMPYAGFLLVALQQLLAEHGDNQWDLQPAAVWPPCSSRPFKDCDVRLVMMGRGDLGRLNGHVEVEGTTDGDFSANGFLCGDYELMSMQEVLHETMGASNDISVVLLANCLLTEDASFSLVRGLCAKCFSVVYDGDGLMCLVSGGDVGTVPAAAAAGNPELESFLSHAASCGCFTTRSVYAHALLLSPMGPLFIQLRQNGHHHQGGESAADPFSGLNDELDEAQLCEWLQCFLWVPQPTIIVLWDDSDKLTETGALVSRLVGLSDGGSSLWSGYRRFSFEADNNNTGACNSSFCGNPPTVYVRDATLKLERAKSLRVDSEVCHTWHVHMSPHCWGCLK
ncbi:hypothetical protein MOQ_006072 [Trypanosoma cruzi marinkellei]|uniref:Uncharacterized protein n=1 Tax=Trypanosoma cruzi marinkellei TaxID=85056 RepID=K2N693_TRYCR|nr:hypothetical protein MOQ_006072 [Trypanosoma cruzi marinkellei]